MTVTAPFTELALVRTKTTDDLTALPDSLILQFLLEYNNKPRKARIYYASADCIEYLTRDLEWNVNKVNDRAFSDNIQVGNIEKYRAKAATLSLKIF
jgi:hypothetical protein